MSLPSLLPQPQQLTPASGTFSLADQPLILLDSADLAALLATAHRLRQAIAHHLGRAATVAAGAAAPAAITLRLQPGQDLPPQGYALAVTPAAITLEAGTAAGVFYGVATLIQLLSQSGPQVPALVIRDWPDFPARGVMLDISRDKVPTQATLFELVDRLAGWKINQLQLYTEHTFAYRRHPEVWAEASPLTGQDVLDLDAYCRERFIELVPNQNSFGHFARWLTHPRYAPLAETHDWFDTPWETRLKGPYSLCPLDPGSLALLRELYDELLPHFTSRQFNVGCDETIDVGQGRSRAAVAAQGAGRVYLDFLRQVHAEVQARGRTMQFWGDIIIAHPELIPELPRDVVALEWGYEADHPFDAHGAQFAAAGVPFYVCPGTSAWNALGGRAHNALGNLRSAAENGRRHGAVGYLITDWGDNGHWQMPFVSDLGLAMGAAYAWAGRRNVDLDPAAMLSAWAYADPSGAMGAAVVALGEAAQAVGVAPHNASALFLALQTPLAELPAQLPGLTAAGYRRGLAAIEAAEARLVGDRCARPDAGLLRREFAWTARMLRRACWRGLGVLGEAVAAQTDLRAEVAEYQALWLARHRPGGLADSVARFEVLRPVRS